MFYSKFIKEAEEAPKIKELLKCLDSCELDSLSKEKISITANFRRQTAQRVNDLLEDQLHELCLSLPDLSFIDGCIEQRRSYGTQSCTQCNWLKCISVLMESHLQKEFPELVFTIGIDWERPKPVWIEFANVDSGFDFMD